MTKIKKMRIIVDPIYGSIPISIIESEILSTKLFNRLHNVLQNSMAYKVYPSDKTTRFAHSLGVMKLSGDMFKYGIINAEDKARENFFKEVDKIFRNKDIDINTLRELLNTDILILSETSYIIKEEYKLHYAVLLQSIRLAGLLHDIGHLPFSHISEFILERIHDDLKRRLEKGEELDNVDMLVYEILNKTITEGDKIHEVLTRNVIRYLFKYELKDRMVEQHKDKADIIEKYLNTLMYITLQILSPTKPNPVFSALHEIISSDIDADRLDFVKRDGTISGLLEGTGRVDRIIKLYTLYYHEDKERNKKLFKFSPSIRSLSDIEQVLTDRFKVYRYLVGHHKVVRFDYLLEKSVHILFNADLKEFKHHILNITHENDKSLLMKKLIEFSSTHNTLLKLIIPVISFKETSKELEKIKMDMLFQIDDYWLLYYLRVKYLELEQINNQLNDTETIKLRCILQEMFTNSKALVTLWKRDEEFYEFILQNRDKFKSFVADLARALAEKVEPTSVGDILEKIESIDSNLLPNFIVDIIEYFVSDATRYGWRYFSTKLESKLEEVYPHKCVFVASVRHKLKVGVNNTLEFYSEVHNKLRDVNTISPVVYHLKLKRGVSKFFDVYYSQDISKDDLLKNLFKNMISLLEHHKRILLKDSDITDLEDMLEDVKEILRKYSRPT